MTFPTLLKSSEELTLGDLSPIQFLAIAVETVKKLGWRVDYTSQMGLVAFTGDASTKITMRIHGRIAIIESEAVENEAVSPGMGINVVEEFTDTFVELRQNFTNEELSQKVSDLQPHLISSENDILDQPSVAKQKTSVEFLSFFMPRAGYFITPILLDLNILIFILMVVSGVDIFLPASSSLISWGANFRPITLEGEWWRLITCCFLHIGIIHLAMNMYALIYIGLLLEPYLWKKRFLAAYLLTGIAASLTSLWWHDLTISAGASGAIFGMYGVFLALLTTNLIPKSARMALLTSITVFVGYNLLNGMRGGIDNAAHLGGLVSGLAIGYTFYFSLKKPESQNLQNAFIGILTFVIISIGFIVYKKLPNDISTYDKRLKLFSQTENTALKIYRMPKNASREELLLAVRDSGIYSWQQNINLLKEVDKLNIPIEFRERDQLLLRYCNLRIGSYNLLYRAIDENTDIYRDSIKYYNGQIEETISTLKNK